MGHKELTLAKSTVFRSRLRYVSLLRRVSSRNPKYPSIQHNQHIDFARCSWHCCKYMQMPKMVPNPPVESYLEHILEHIIRDLKGFELWNNSHKSTPEQPWTTLTSTEILGKSLPRSDKIWLVKSHGFPAKCFLKLPANANMISKKRSRTWNHSIPRQSVRFCERLCTKYFCFQVLNSSTPNSHGL